MADHARMLGLIAVCQDPAKLRTWIENGRSRGQGDIEEAAFRRLIAILPNEEPGTVAYDLWQTIHAFEHVLSDERGKTTRLARTRQKVARVGEVETLKDWATARQSTDGFRMFLERNMPELTGEAIVLRHARQFAPEVVEAARKRLMGSGIDIHTLPQAAAA